MKTPFLNYDQIASEYNQRYSGPKPSARGQVLLDLARHVHAKKILEAGCGTGFWLNLLGVVTNHLYGLDLSMEMIHYAQKRTAPLKLTRGNAIQLPFQNGTFELVYCVDALHHFGDHRAFIREAYRVLKPRGALASFGQDPHAGTSKWYAHDYFETVHETDMNRYSPGTSLMAWMKAEGFENVSSRVAERIHSCFSGRDVFHDPFLKHHACSQLALLSDSQYEAGLKKIESVLENAEARGERITFESSLLIFMFVGYKPT